MFNLWKDILIPSTFEKPNGHRNDEGDLIVTISQNSIGNAITELLGVVVKRVPDAEAYEKAEPALVDKLLEVRDRLIKADLGDAIETPYWSA